VTSAILAFFPLDGNVSGLTLLFLLTVCANVTLDQSKIAARQHRFDLCLYYVHFVSFFVTSIDRFEIVLNFDHNPSLTNSRFMRQKI